MRVQAAAQQALQLSGRDSTSAAAGKLLQDIGAWGPHSHAATLAFRQQVTFDAALEVGRIWHQRVLTSSCMLGCWSSGILVHLTACIKCLALRVMWQRHVASRWTSKHMLCKQRLLLVACL